MQNKAEHFKLAASMVVTYLAMYGGLSLVFALVGLGLHSAVPRFSVTMWFGFSTGILIAQVVRHQTIDESFIWKIGEGLFTLGMILLWWFCAWSPLMQSKGWM